jgi:hypothetical protein
MTAQPVTFLVDAMTYATEMLSDNTPISPETILENAKNKFDKKFASTLNTCKHDTKTVHAAIESSLKLFKENNKPYYERRKLLFERLKYDINLDVPPVQKDNGLALIHKYKPGTPADVAKYKFTPMKETSDYTLYNSYRIVHNFAHYYTNTGKEFKSVTELVETLQTTVTAKDVDMYSQKLSDAVDYIRLKTTQ